MVEVVAVVDHDQQLVGFEHTNQTCAQACATDSPR
jgi:hypothetical protein